MGGCGGSYSGFDDAIEMKVPRMKTAASGGGSFQAVCVCSGGGGGGGGRGECVVCIVSAAAVLLTTIAGCGDIFPSLPLLSGQGT